MQHVNVLSCSKGVRLVRLRIAFYPLYNICGTSVLREEEKKGKKKPLVLTIHHLRRCHKVKNASFPDKVKELP